MLTARSTWPWRTKPATTCRSCLIVAMTVLRIRVIFTDFSGGIIVSSFSAPADLDGDGQVGAADLAILLGNWGPCVNCGICPADLDGDCAVGPADLAILLGNWG